MATEGSGGDAGADSGVGGAFRDGTPTPNPLRSFIEDTCNLVLANGDPRANEWDRVRSLVGDDRLFSATVTLAEVRLENMHLVSTFSFLGDSDPEVGEIRAMPQERLGTGGSGEGGSTDAVRGDAGNSDAGSRDAGSGDAHA